MKHKIAMIVAVTAGLLAAILTRAYLNARDAEYREKLAGMDAATADVLVYRKDIPGGTALGRDNIGVKTVPLAGIEGRALMEADFAKIEKVRVKSWHRTGEVVFWTDLDESAGGVRGLAGSIAQGMRAVSVNASGAAAVSGMIRPNDHVDVLGTFSFPSPDGKKDGREEIVTMTVLQNVTVLATGSQTADDAARRMGGGGYSTVTLLVTPREAEVLVFAEQIRGRISLSLRSPSDNICEKELPNVDFAKIRAELEELNSKRNKGNVR